MQEHVLVVFRSRTQVLSFKKILSGAGVVSEIVSTPRQIAIGCGLSLKVAQSDYEQVKRIYEIYKPHSFVGFYFSHFNG